MIRTFLAHGSNAVLVLLVIAWLAAIAAGLCGIHTSLLLLGFGAVTIGEDGFHRFVLHAPSARAGSVIHRLQHRLHYDHHAQPDRLDRLFLPLWLFLPCLLLALLLASCHWRDPGRLASLAAGIVIATLNYEWTHYAAHSAYRPRTAWGRRLKNSHLWHHFRNEHYWFGVTHPGVDLLMHTYKRPEAVARSSTVREIARP